jgi:cell division septal protein FtsQ
MKTRRTTGNRRKSGRMASRQHLLELNVRTASVKRQRRSKLGGLLWKVSTVVIVAAVGALAIRLACRKFFFNNSEYSLRHLETNLHDVMTEQELVALTGFTPGSNLFLLDLEQANRKLAALPEVRSVSIERRLPDTLEVGIQRRIPLFMLASSGEGEAAGAASAEAFVPGKSLLCDRDGMLIQPSRLSDEFLHLPVLTGIDLSQAAPGKKLESDRFEQAVMLVEALSEIPEEGIQIRSVDVSKPYAVIVTDTSNARFTFGTKDLPGQLERLRKLLAHCHESGRKIETVNLMIQRNTPVTFVMTPENRGQKITPVPVSGSKEKR